MSLNNTCVIYCRVSTTKQAQEGESLATQERLCREIARDRGYVVVPDGRVFSEPFSGRKDHRPVFDEMMAYIKKNRGAVRFVLVRMIDRLTRAGSTSYDLMKRELAAYDVQLIDSMGIIQPHMNTLAHLGVEFDWSRYSPSELTEKMMADYGTTEVRHILTRLIGREIELVREGYKIGPTQDGYVNQKVVVDGKKRVIQVPDPERAKFFVELYRLRALGTLSDKEIVARINAMGYRTRVQNRWNEGHDTVVAKRGGRPLSVKGLQEAVRKPIYAGIVVHRWTDHQPVRARYPGLVDIATFNAANRGRVVIQERPDGALAVLYDQRPTRLVVRRNRQNPLFPFKSVVLCPECRKPFTGSAPRGRLGKRHPTYHCARGHRYFGVKKQTFEDNLAALIRQTAFTPEFLENFDAALTTVWERRKNEVAGYLREVEEHRADMEAKKQHLIDALLGATSPVVRAALERRIEELDAAAAGAAAAGPSEATLTRADLDGFKKSAWYLMEHHADLLLSQRNIARLPAIYSLVFETWPTYAEILNGTPSLTLAFALSERVKREQVDLVDEIDLRWNTIANEVKRYPLVLFGLTRLGQKGSSCNLTSQSDYGT